MGYVGTKRVEKNVENVEQIKMEDHGKFMDSGLGTDMKVRKRLGWNHVKFHAKVVC